MPQLLAKFVPLVQTLILVGIDVRARSRFDRRWRRRVALSGRAQRGRRCVGDRRLYTNVYHIGLGVNVQCRVMLRFLWTYLEEVSNFDYDTTKKGAKG